MFGMLFAGSDNDSLNAYPVERPASRPSQPLPGHDFMESHASLALATAAPSQQLCRGKRHRSVSRGSRRRSSRRRRCKDLDQDLWVDGSMGWFLVRSSAGFAFTFVGYVRLPENELIT